MTGKGKEINPPAPVPAPGPVSTPAKHPQTTQPATFEKAAGKVALLPVRQGQSEQRRVNDQLAGWRELRKRSGAKIDRLQKELLLEKDTYEYIDKLIQQTKTDQAPLHRMAALSQQAADLLRPFHDLMATAIRLKIDQEVEEGEALLSDRQPTPDDYRPQPIVEEENVGKAEAEEIPDDIEEESYEDL
jgi:hypothetical protein